VKQLRGTARAAAGPVHVMVCGVAQPVRAASVCGAIQAWRLRLGALEGRPDTSSARGPCLPEDLLAPDLCPARASGAGAGWVRGASGGAVWRVPICRMGCAGSRELGFRWREGKKGNSVCNGKGKGKEEG
jgi:hypothetical protein